MAKAISEDQYFPTGKEIIYFEGTRGPDGLKRKSPGEDEPSHMWSDSPNGAGVRKLIKDYRPELLVVDICESAWLTPDILPYLWGF